MFTFNFHPSEKYRMLKFSNLCLGIPLAHQMRKRNMEWKLSRITVTIMIIMLMQHLSTTTWFHALAKITVHIPISNEKFIALFIVIKKCLAKWRLGAWDISRSSHGNIVFLVFNFVYFPRGHKVPILTMITASILLTLDKDHIISLEMLVSAMKLTY